MQLEGNVAIVTGASRGVGAATAIALRAARVPRRLRGARDGRRTIADTRHHRRHRPPHRGSRRRGDRSADEPRARRRDRRHGGDHDRNVRPRRHPREQRRDHLPGRPRTADEALRSGDASRHARAAHRDCNAVVRDMRARGTGAILNVSSMAALNYFPSLMAYGMAKAAMEHMTMSAAHQLRPLGIAVNTFRIDVPVASEGFVVNFPTRTLPIGSLPKSRPKASSGCSSSPRPTRATTWAWPNSAPSTASWSPGRAVRITSSPRW